MEARRNLPRPGNALNILFRKFSAHRLKLKELREKVETKKKAKILEPQLENLEAQAKRIQELKKSYSFGETANAQSMARAFVEALETFEYNFKQIKSNAQKLGL